MNKTTLRITVFTVFLFVTGGVRAYAQKPGQPSVKDSMSVDFKLMERRNVASAMGWRNVRSGAVLHYRDLKRANGDESHRTYLYQFVFSPDTVEVFQTHKMHIKIVSFNGKKVLFQNQETVDVSGSEFTYNFKELLYDVTEQIITVDFRGNKSTFRIKFDLNDNQFSELQRKRENEY